MSEDLDKYFSYRLINILYSTLLFFGIIILIMSYWPGQHESLITAIMHAFIPFAVIFLLLNIFREGMLYLVLQKQFSWNWFSLGHLKKHRVVAVASLAVILFGATQ